MAENIQSFFARLDETARSLQSPATLDLITNVRQQTNNSRLRILIVGSTGVGRASLANLIVGQPDLLPVSPIPKAPITVSVVSGESGTAQVTNRAGIKSPLPTAKLRTFLTGGDTNVAKLEVQAEDSLLNMAEIQVETIGAERSTKEWQEVLAGADYAILVLKAIALLSSQEKAFVRDVLNSHFGLERVAIVINQIDLVEPEERASVVEQVRAFLGSFESQPMIVEFSAAQALKSTDDADNAGWEKLSTFIKKDLVEQSAALKQAALRTAATICLDAVGQEANRQLGLLSGNQEELARLRERLSQRDKWLQDRTQRTQHRVDTFINTLLKEEFFRDIEGFNLALRSQLPEEIRSARDLQTIRKNAPGYLEMLWMQYFDRKLNEVKSRLTAELQNIDNMINEDLKELAGEEAVVQKLLGDFDTTPSNLRSFLMPRRADSQIGTFATFAQLGGFIFLAIGFLPGALAGLGGGQLVRMFFKGNIERADKEAIIHSMLDSLLELELQIKRQVESQFARLTDQLKGTVAQTYHTSVEKLRSGLATHDGKVGDVSERRAALQKLIEETLPELRHTLDHLAPATTLAVDAC